MLLATPILLTWYPSGHGKSEHALYVYFTIEIFLFPSLIVLQVWKRKKSPEIISISRSCFSPFTIKTKMSTDLLVVV